jgi:FkbM family methyltransferase
MINKHKLIVILKYIFLGKYENYVFANLNLKFKIGTRPIKRKYLNAHNDVVRNDVLQINYFESNFKHDDVLWDIGSHNGHYAIFAAAIAQQNNQVLAFEPDSIARLVLIENIALNNLNNKIQVFPFAISNINGEVNFDQQNGNANSKIIKGTHVFTNSNVKSYTLDTLCDNYRIPTYIKIDVEGAEIDIINEAKTLLINPNVKFIVELHPFAWADFNVSYDMLVKQLEKYNRKITPLDPQKKMNELPFYGTVLF